MTSSQSYFQFALTLLSIFARNCLSRRIPNILTVSSPRNSLKFIVVRFSRTPQTDCMIHARNLLRYEFVLYHSILHHSGCSETLQHYYANYLAETIHAAPAPPCPTTLGLLRQKLVPHFIDFPPFWLLKLKPAKILSQPSSHLLL